MKNRGKIFQLHILKMINWLIIRQQKIKNAVTFQNIKIAFFVQTNSNNLNLKTLKQNQNYYLGLHINRHQNQMNPSEVMYKNVRNICQI